MAAISNSSSPSICLKDCTDQSNSIRQAIQDCWWRRRSCRPFLSLTRELGLVVLLRFFLLSHILPVLRWVPLLEEGGEPHRMITGLNSLNPTIQSPFTREKIRKVPSTGYREAHFSLDLLSRFCGSLQKGQARVQPIPSLNFFFWQGDKEELITSIYFSVIAISSKWNTNSLLAYSYYTQLI